MVDRELILGLATYRRISSLAYGAYALGHEPNAEGRAPIADCRLPSDQRRPPPAVHRVRWVPFC